MDTKSDQVAPGLFRDVLGDFFIRDFIEIMFPIGARSHCGNSTRCSLSAPLSMPGVLLP
jgi:hypothetical protein